MAFLHRESVANFRGRLLIATAVTQRKTITRLLAEELEREANRLQGLHGGD